MKKLGICLLAGLLLLSMLFGSYAEQENESTVLQIEEEHTEEEAIAEVGEFDLVSAELTEEEETTGYADFVGEINGTDTSAEYGVAAPLPPESEAYGVAAAASPEFVIENGVLTKYSGPGGTIVIPEGVTVIRGITENREYADHYQSFTYPVYHSVFANMEGEVTDVILPASLVSIEDGAFSGTHIQSITLPNGLKSIGKEAFQACTYLKSISLPDSITSIENNAFFNCQNLESVILPKGLSAISKSTFAYCKNLKNIVLPDGLKSIGHSAFRGCEKIETVNIPGSVNTIDEWAFLECWGIKNLTIGQGVQSIGDMAFWRCDGLTSVVIPNSVTNMGSGVFEECKALESITIPSSVTEIGSGSFEDCANLTIYTTYLSKAHEYALNHGIKYVLLDIPETVLAKAGNNGLLTINRGEKLLLTPAFSTAAGADVIGFKSSKPKVASVDGNGLVTAIAEGKANITIITNNKKVKATVTVKVVDPYKPTGVSIAQGKTVTLSVGQPLQMNASLAPATAQATLTWKSGNPKVASVDGNGIVTPVKEGTTKVTVSTHNNKRATVTVKVVDPYKPTGVSIANGKSLTLKVGETVQLNTAMNPATAQSTLTWKSNNAAIAAVNDNGLVTTAKKGKTTITVITYNKKKATIMINVVE